MPDGQQQTQGDGQQQQQQTQAAPWYGNDANLKGIVELKGWDTPAKAIESYTNLEKLVGADKAGRGVIWPKDDADTEGWNGIFTKMGRPEKPDGYKLPVPDGQDPNFAKSMAPLLHKHGLSQRQAEGLAADWNAMQAAQMKAFDDNAKIEDGRAIDALKREWGGEFDKRTEFGKRAARELGLDADGLGNLEAALGTAGMLKLLVNMGTKMGEDKFVSDGKDSKLGLTPDAAKAAIASKMQDTEFGKKLMAGDAATLAEWNRLNEVAAQAAAA